MAPAAPPGYLAANYEPVAPIAAGGQGRVYLMRHKRSGTLVAVKQSLRSSTCDEDEVKVVARHLDPQRYNVPRTLECFKEPGAPLTIVTPFNNGGSLDRIIQAYRDEQKLMPEAFVWHVVACLTEVLAHAQRHRVVHRDIKPQNIFVRWSASAPRDRNYPNILLGDWGIGISVDDPAFRVRDPFGTFIWQPPELPAGTFAADMWSVGAVAHALCTHKPPIREPPPGVWHSPRAIADWYGQGVNRCITDITDQHYSPGLYAALRYMMRFRVDERARADDVRALFEAKAERHFARAFKPLIPRARTDAIDLGSSSQAYDAYVSNGQPVFSLRDRGAHDRRARIVQRQFARQPQQADGNGNVERAFRRAFGDLGLEHGIRNRADFIDVVSYM